MHLAKAHGKFATRDTENADKNVGNEIMLGHRDTKNADRLLGHRDIKNADNLGHRDTETVDINMCDIPRHVWTDRHKIPGHVRTDRHKNPGHVWTEAWKIWDTGTLKMQTKM